MNEIEVSTPELVFGLVAPLGVRLEAVQKKLEQELRSVGYSVSSVRLSTLLHGLKGKEWSELADIRPRDEWIERHIKAGNEFCKRIGREDAMALLGLGEIRDQRSKLADQESIPAQRHAYVVRSLKRKRELETLRRIYGDRFVAVACYAPEANRLEELSKEIARSRKTRETKEASNRARRLINVDEAQTDHPYGQYVRDVFPLADVFIDATETKRITASISRFIELIFGHNQITPNLSELGMYFAQAASFRSASLSRQVGAAICDEKGGMISVGTNEVPKAFGGQYWPPQSGETDGRDHTFDRDPAVQMLESLLSDTVERLSKWFTRKYRDLDADSLLKEARERLEGGYLMDIIEYSRSVHAEMAALIDASRRGAAVDGARLFSTTMPCHDCAKHIVASGVTDVEYIEPYPKSLAADFYPDSIELDALHGMRIDKVAFRQFVGVAPKRFDPLFLMEKTLRKNRDGTVVDWQSLNPKKPRVDRNESAQKASILMEQRHYAMLVDELKKFKFV